MADDDDFRKATIRPVPNPPSSPQQIVDQIKDGLRDAFRDFGGKRGGGGNGGSRGGTRGGGSSGQSYILLGILLAGFTVWGVLSSFYTVDISEEGVVTRFGAYHRTVPPGFHLKMPFGVENIIKVQSKKILQEEFGFRTLDTRGDRSSFDKEPYIAESLMLTGDLNVGDVEWILQYRIADPWKYLFHAQDVRRNIRDLSMSIMRRVVGDRLVGDVLTTGRVEIADQAKHLTQEVLNEYDMGIVVEKIILQGVNPPETVKPAFNEVNAAKQEQEQTINNAEREYNKIIPEARGKAEKVIADAEAYAIDVVNRAKGDASLFSSVIAEYRKAPEITKRRIFLETMESLFSGASELTVVDSNVKGILPVYPGTEAPKSK